MTGIQWREGLSVGVADIDDDHKALIAIINEFLTSVRRNPQPEALKSIADRLLDYANRHFEREERLQVLANYEFHDEHREHHNRLVGTLEAFIQRYFIDKRDPIDEMTAIEMDGFLRTWLIDHILKEDTKMKGKLG